MVALCGQETDATTPTMTKTEAATSGQPTATRSTARARLPSCPSRISRGDYTAALRFDRCRRPRLADADRHVTGWGTRGCVARVTVRRALTPSVTGSAHGPPSRPSARRRPGRGRRVCARAAGTDAD